MENFFDIDIDVNVREYNYFVSGWIRIEDEEDSVRTTFEKKIDPDGNWESAELRTAIDSKDIPAEGFEMNTIMSAVVRRVLRRIDEHYEEIGVEEYRDSLD
jgi:hypothetical protein